MDKNNEMSDEEIEQMAKVLGNAYASIKKDNASNIYQKFAIAFGIIGVLSSIVLLVTMESFMFLIIGCFAALSSSLFLYGFGTALKDIGIIRKTIQSMVTRNEK